jgi:hypothetical protein
MNYNGEIMGNNDVLRDLLAVMQGIQEEGAVTPAEEAVF